MVESPAAGLLRENHSGWLNLQQLGRYVRTILELNLRSIKAMWELSLVCDRCRSNRPINEASLTLKYRAILSPIGVKTVTAQGFVDCLTDCLINCLFV